MIQNLAESYMGVVTEKEIGPTFWIVRSYHLGGVKKNKICSISAFPTKREAMDKVRRYQAINKSISAGICPSTGKPLATEMLGITYSIRDPIELFEVGNHCRLDLNAKKVEDLE